jgi:transposase
LVGLIRESAKPLADLEAGGAVAIDSSGFATSVFGAYLTQTHDPDRKREFVKGHIAVGTRTHVVIDVVVTTQFGGDSPQFVPLLRGALETGFRPSIVVADKAYLSRANYLESERMGVKAYIPFRTNVGPTPKGVRVWRDMWHLFQLNREEFDSMYHDRSNVEASFSAIKRLLGESLFSKRPEARQNELLCKILAYNITVLIHESFERGVDLSSLFERGGPPRTPMERHPPLEESNSPEGCENIDSLVKETPLGAE